MIATGSPADSIELIATVISNDANFQKLPYEYYEYKKDYKQAYRGVIEVLHQNDSLFIERYHSSVSHEVKGYMDEEQAKAELRISHLNNIIVWIIISGVLLICLLVVMVRFYAVSRKKREKDLLYTLEILTKEKSEIVSRIDKLNSDNKNLSDENDLLKTKYAHYIHNRQDVQENESHFESDLLSKLFCQLDGLQREYYFHGKSEQGTGRIMERLSKLVELLRENMGLLNDMEGHINRDYDGVLAQVYGAVRLNVNQRRMVALLIMGFSKEAVCQIMGIEMSSFYLRMNRLVKRIDGCRPPKQTEFLALIGRGKV